MNAPSALGAVDQPPALWAAHQIAAPRDPGLELSVVVPVKNEAPNIARLVDEICTALDPIAAFEIVYVDDGSDDATPIELAAAQMREPRLRVLRHRHSNGQSAALRAGILAARAPLIATLDGDGQNDPADLAAFVQAFRATAEGSTLALIGGDRSQNRRDRWIKRISSRIANGVRARFLGDRTRDTGCGLKLFRRDAYLLLPFFDHQHRFLPALFLREGFTIRSLTAAHRPRIEGRSKYGTLDRLAVGIVDLWGVAWLRRRRRAIAPIEER